MDLLLINAALRLSEGKLKNLMQGIHVIEWKLIGVKSVVRYEFAIPCLNHSIASVIG